MSEAGPLQQLEDEIARAAAKLRRLQSENRKLESQVAELEAEMEAARKTQGAQDQLLRKLRRQRKAIREGVLNIQEKLTALEEPMKESAGKGR